MEWFYERPSALFSLFGNGAYRIVASRCPVSTESQMSDRCQRRQNGTFRLSDWRAGERRICCEGEGFDNNAKISALAPNPSKWRNKKPRLEQEDSGFKLRPIPSTQRSRSATDHQQVWKCLRGTHHKNCMGTRVGECTYGTTLDHPVVSPKSKPSTKTIVQTPTGVLIHGSKSTVPVLASTIESPPPGPTPDGPSTVPQ